VLQREQGDAYGRSLQTVNNENRIKHLRAEVKALQQRVTKEQEKMKGIFSGQGGTKSLLDKAGSIGAQEFPINSSFALDSQNALYRLSLEIQSPLDMVILRSPAMLELKDSDLGATVVSVIPKEYLIEPSDMGSNVEAGAKFVAAYRCQNGEKRLTISLRPTEGFYGDLTVIVVACCNPKAAKVLKFPLRPLSLHSKVHDLSFAQETAPRSKVSFRGSISIDMVHEWIQFLFPEVIFLRVIIEKINNLFLFFLVPQGTIKIARRCG
jgi:Bardet-Biedl syndrome 7 protein